MPVNVSDPIGQYARFVLLPDESVLDELLTGTHKGGTAGTTETVAGHLAYKPASTATTWPLVETELDPYVSGDFSLLWYGVIAENTEQTLISCSGGYGWSLTTYYHAPGYVLLRFGTIWGGALQRSYLLATDNVTPIAIGAVYTDSTSNGKLYVNGSLVDSGTFTKDPGAMGSGQTFSVLGDATTPIKIITAQAYARALSGSDISTLSSDPFSIFSAPALTLTASNCTQGNAGGTGTIGITGVLFGANCSQGNVSGTGSITRVQDLTGANSTQANTSGTGSTDPYGRLRGIIAATNSHEWVKVSTNSFLDVTVPSSSLPVSGVGNSAAVVYAWASFAWDTANGNLILWGGGHANYEGNEVYIWNGETGLWDLGSLPSLVDMSDVSLVIPSKDGPQSSHTYSNNVYLPNNRMFCTFGGAAAPSGGPFEEIVTYSPHVTRRVGPWCFDLALADPDKVGGANGTGWDVTKLGSNAWYNRVDMIDGTYPIPPGGSSSHVGGAAIVVDEDGVDVAYFTMSTGSGLPYWYRYEFGDIRSGGRDTITKIAETWDGVSFDGFGIWDSTRGMFYRNSSNNTLTDVELLALHVSTATGTTHVTPIQLVDSVGDPFILNEYDSVNSQWIREVHYGSVYDPENDRIWLWNADVAEPGRVYYINPPAWDSGTGWASTTWTVNELIPSGSTPRGGHGSGVLGKMRYVPALGAFAVLDSTNLDRTDDPGVWLFKTSQTNSLSGSGSTQGNTSSTGAISQSGAFVAANCTQGNVSASGAVTVDSGITLAAANSIQANESTVGAISVDGVIALVCAPSVQDNIAQASAIVQAHILAASNVTQGNSSPSRSITLGDALPLRSLVTRQGTFTRTKTVTARFN